MVAAWDSDSPCEDVKDCSEEALCRFPDLEVCRLKMFEIFLAWPTAKIGYFISLLGEVLIEKEDHGEE